jgi:hypothetical protein
MHHIVKQKNEFKKGRIKMSIKQAKVFVDCHCHLFNLQDIPLYPAICDAANDFLSNNPILGVRFLRLIAGSFAATQISQQNINKILLKLSNSILFFNRSIDGNVLKLYNEIKLSGMQNKTIILTPLAMDFENLPLPDGFTKPNDLPVKDIKTQVRRLQEGINRICADVHSSKLLIYPFTGFDLNKLSDANALNNFKKHWLEIRGVIPKQISGQIPSGRAIGIKIYPPISNTPIPDDDQLMANYLTFFKWCCNSEIPITAHCQRGSFNIVDQNAMNERTHPVNWMRLIFDNDKILSDMRLNLAHFGGEDSMVKFVKDFQDYEECFFKYVFNIKQEPERPESWCAVIISLMKTYPNVYSDIAAFEFKEGEPEALRQIMRWDDEGRFDIGNPPEDDDSPCYKYKLRNKLLWGSDVPMIISDPAYRENGDNNGETAYKHLFTKFKSLCCDDGNDGPAPGRSWLYRMTCVNPLKFLFGERASERTGQPID